MRGVVAQMMYASSGEELASAQDSFFVDDSHEDDDFLVPLRTYRTRVEKFLERGDEWLVLRRQEMLTRGNNTNNYSESTMRVLKDIILSRTKAFNVVALVDFCSTVLQAYLVRRLLAFAHGRRADPRLVYTALCDRMKDVASQTATVVDDYIFLVPSCSRASTIYTVDAEFGLCACASGQSGAFCKHQAFVHERFHIPFPNAPAVSIDDRHKLAVVALGSKCPGKDFFCSMQDVCDKEQADVLPTVPARCDNVNNNITEDLTASSSTEAAVDCDNVAAVVDKLRNEITRMQSLVTPNTASAVEDFIPILQAIKTEQDLITAVYLCRPALRTRQGGAIKVQPTAVARRRPGVTRGCKRVPAGRPPAEPKRPHKRARVLAANICRNMPHAKSHGVGH